jgi:hypothetical protein
MSAVLLLIVVIGAPIAYLLWRLRREEAAPGGSQGKQIFGREHDDWGPKP